MLFPVDVDLDATTPALAAAPSGVLPHPIGRRGVPTPGGGIAYPPPPPPDAARRLAGSACGRRRSPVPAGGARVLVPPPLGLSAHVAGAVVGVRVDPGRPPAACRPRAVLILIDDDDPSVPLEDERVELCPQRDILVRIPIPRSLRSAPTVARASAATADGRANRPVSVRVRP
jgi:hypothetical protein